MGAQRDQCTRLSSLRPIPEVPSAPLLPTHLSHTCPSSLEPCTWSPAMDPVIHLSTHSRGRSPSTFPSVVSGPSPQPLLAATREPGAVRPRGLWSACSCSITGNRGCGCLRQNPWPLAHPLPPPRLPAFSFSRLLLLFRDGLVMPALLAVRRVTELWGWSWLCWVPNR